MKVTHIPPKPQMIVFEHFKTDENKTAGQVLDKFDSDWVVISSKESLVTTEFSPLYFWPIYFVKFERKFETLKSVSDAVRDLGFIFANAGSLASLNWQDSSISRKFQNLTLWQDKDLNVHTIAFDELDSVNRVVTGLASDVLHISDIETNWIACQRSFRPHTPNLIN